MVASVGSLRTASSSSIFRISHLSDEYANVQLQVPAKAGTDRVRFISFQSNTKQPSTVHMGRVAEAHIDLSPDADQG
jgi:hypothetical protein